MKFGILEICFSFIFNWFFIWYSFVSEFIVLGIFKFLFIDLIVFKVEIFELVGLGSEDCVIVWGIGI